MCIEIFLIAIIVKKLFNAWNNIIYFFLLFVIWIFWSCWYSNKAVWYQPGRVLHIVWIPRRLLVNVTAGPLLHLSQWLHHTWVGSWMSAWEVLGYVGGGSYTATLRRMLLHAHVRCICGIALTTYKYRANCDSACANNSNKWKLKKKSPNQTHLWWLHLRIWLVRCHLPHLRPDCILVLLREMMRWIKTWKVQKYVSSLTKPKK